MAANIKESIKLAIKVNMPKQASRHTSSYKELFFSSSMVYQVIGYGDTENITLAVFDTTSGGNMVFFSNNCIESLSESALFEDYEELRFIETSFNLDINFNNPN